MDGFGTVAPSPSRPQATLAPKAQNPPVGRALACHDFADGEQMSRLSSALGACFPNHRLRPVQRDEDSPGAGG
jgi:hypothetical protein